MTTLRLLKNRRNSLVRFFCSSTTSSSSDKLTILHVNDQSGYATFELNRPPVNSLNLELVKEFSQALTDLEKNKCRGMILTSTSNRVFCAGLDLMELYKPNEDRLREFWTKLQDVWLQLYSSSFQTAAAINGHAVGFGSILAASCDYRVIGSQFTIGMIATKLGIIPPCWFIAPFQNILSRRNVEIAMIEGKLFRSKNALSVGLIDEISNDKNDAVGKCEKFLDRYKNIPSMARSLTKRQLRQKDINTLELDREGDFDDFFIHITSDKMQKSLQQHMEDLKGNKK